MLSCPVANRGYRLIDSAFVTLGNVVIAQRVAFLKAWKTREANMIAHKADGLATGPEAREKQRAHFKEEKLRLERFMVQPWFFVCVSIA